MIVLDAAAAVHYLLRREPGRTWLADRIENCDVLHAPHLLDFEAASALRRLVQVGEVAAERGLLALSQIDELHLVRYPAARLRERIWELRSNLTAYDAAYVALAEVLEMPLVTTDTRLARSAGHTAEILTPVGDAV
ncbi:MAG TPA: type II toxin-antitoxin system VapC family toxin [Gaiellaceae bacterium]|nr:type II toxin-antitoxin system VapC family toxin [Gaiellaceae bacterium]